jgi:hypothetical protein
MKPYTVVLRSASGRERVVYVTAKTDTGASNAALRQAEPGEMVAKVR